MASSALLMKLVCIGLVGIMLAIAPHAEAAVSCGTVSSALSPCIGYINGGALSAACCSGIKNLAAQATTTASRQTICKCLKSYPGAGSKAGQVVSACKISIPYSLSPSTDCSKVK